MDSIGSWQNCRRRRNSFRRTKSYLSVLLAWLVAGSPAHGQSPRELSTDRPDKTESPYTVDPGRFQIEMDLLSYTTDRIRTAGGSIWTTTVSVGATNFKYGLGRNTDVQLLVKPFVRETRTAGAIRGRESTSFADVTVRLKHNLWGNDSSRSALAIMPFATIPTRGDGRPVEFGVIVPLAVQLSDNLGFGVMTEFDLVTDEDGRGYQPAWVNSATLSVNLTRALGSYAEIFTQLDGDGNWLVTGDAGLTLGIGDDLQLDAGVNVGLTESAPDLNLFVGISRRF